MDAELRAGWARADISPPLGIHMGGYCGRSSGATEILDPLEAKAVVSDNDSSVVLLVLDIVALAAADVQIIRDRITVATGISPQAVMVCCTHTHAGPLTLAFRGMGENGHGLRLHDPPERRRRAGSLCCGQNPRTGYLTLRPDPPFRSDTTGAIHEVPFRPSCRRLRSSSRRPRPWSSAMHVTLWC